MYSGSDIKDLWSVERPATIEQWTERVEGLHIDDFWSEPDG